MFYIVDTDIPVYFLIGFGVFGVFQEEKLAKRYINNKIRWYMRFFLNMNDDGMYRIDYFKPKCKNGLKMDSPTDSVYRTFTEDKLIFTLNNADQIQRSIVLIILGLVL